MYALSSKRKLWGGRHVWLSGVGWGVPGVEAWTGPGLALGACMEELQSRNSSLGGVEECGGGGGCRQWS